eukprot:1436232-Amphidinium_carterae.2
MHATHQASLRAQCEVISCAVTDGQHFLTLLHAVLARHSVAAHLCVQRSELCPELFSKWLLKFQYPQRYATMYEWRRPFLSLLTSGFHFAITM